MNSMFHGATAFNGDLSKWDVSRVTTMIRTFFYAYSFTRTLCGTWVLSTAEGKWDMLQYSGGSMALHPDVCTPNWVPAITVIFTIAVIIVVKIIHCRIKKRAQKRQQRAHERFLSD